MHQIEDLVLLSQPYSFPCSSDAQSSLRILSVHFVGPAQQFPDVSTHASFLSSAPMVMDFGLSMGRPSARLQMPCI